MGLYEKYWTWMSGASRPVRAVFHVGVAVVGFIVLASLLYGFKPAMLALGLVTFVLCVFLWLRLDTQP